MSLEEKLQALVAEWRKDVQFCLKESDRYADMQESLRSERFLTRGRTKENCADELEALLAVAEPPTVREQLNEMFGKEKVDYAIAEAETGVAEPPALVPETSDIALAHSAFAPYPDRSPAPWSLSAEQKHEQFLAWWIQQKYINSYPTSIMGACESAWNGALLSAPRCIAYPDCDGDLEGEPHSEKCLATALAERQEPPTGTLTDRRAEFVYDAARLAAIAAQAPIVPVLWAEREDAFKTQFLTVIERQCGEERSNSPEELHASWMHAYFAMGWVYGEKYDRERKIHPDLVSYAQLGQLERDKDAVFVALCEIARNWIYEAAAPSSGTGESK